MVSVIPFFRRGPLVSVIRMQGVIASGPRGALSDAALAQPITRAFAKKPAAVALVINSPGGSPAQSSLIAARIRRLAEEKGVPVVAFVEDVAASGGYWLAAAADEIFVDQNSIVGSIGVISAGFGFQDFIERHGIERRVHTAGRSKAMLDPFRPEREEDVTRLRRIQDQIHEAFIGYVKDRRKARLAENDDLFTGEIWVGEAAVEVGLADGLGHIGKVMKDRFGDKVRFQSYSRRRPLLGRLGAAAVGAALSEVEGRAHWARYGL